MAKGLLTFVKTFFEKAPQDIKHVATTLTSQGTVVQKSLKAVTSTKRIKHTYQPGSHMADLGVISTTLFKTKTPNNMAVHGNKPHYVFSSLNVKCKDGTNLTFLTQEAAKNFFVSANKYNSSMSRMRV